MTPMQIPASQLPLEEIKPKLHDYSSLRFLSDSELQTLVTSQTKDLRKVLYLTSQEVSTLRSFCENILSEKQKLSEAIILLEGSMRAERKSQAETTEQADLRDELRDYSIKELEDNLTEILADLNLSEELLPLRKRAEEIQRAIRQLEASFQVHQLRKLQVEADIVGDKINRLEDKRNGNKRTQQALDKYEQVAVTASDKLVRWKDFEKQRLRFKKPWETTPKYLPDAVIIDDSRRVLYCVMVKQIYPSLEERHVESLKELASFRHRFNKSWDLRLTADNKLDYNELICYTSIQTQIAATRAREGRLFVVLRNTEGEIQDCEEISIPKDDSYNQESDSAVAADEDEDSDDDGDRSDIARGEDRTTQGTLDTDEKIRPAVDRQSADGSSEGSAGGSGSGSGGGSSTGSSSGAAFSEFVDSVERELGVSAEREIMEKMVDSLISTPNRDAFYDVMRQMLDKRDKLDEMVSEFSKSD